MPKRTLEPRPYLYPMPIVLVGANVNNRPNYLVVAYCGIVQHEPPMLAVSLNKAHYTNGGMQQNKTFSVNIPCAPMLEMVDYCGIVSGRTVDKSALFTTFYGQLETAPMIEECALNIECRVTQTLDIPGTNTLYIGQIVQVYTEEKFLTNGAPDLAKMDPLLFSIHENAYYRSGERIGLAWHVGRDYLPPRD